MLEISSLDVSQEKLPCKEANLNSICIQEMTLLNRSHKPDIDYRIDLPEHPIRYLSRLYELVGVLRRCDNGG